MKSACTIKAACEALAAGELVIVPTETVYGVACDPSVPGAVEQLVAAKGRDEGKPFARLVATPSLIKKQAVSWSKGLDALAEKYWPGSVTIVLETDVGFVGYRVPTHPIALELAQEYGKELALTSANRSGCSETYFAEEARTALGVDCVLDGGNLSPTSLPTTVVKVDGSSISCLREGAVAFAEVESLFYEEMK